MDGHQEELPECDIIIRCLGTEEHFPLSWISWKRTLWCCCLLPNPSPTISQSFEVCNTSPVSVIYKWNQHAVCPFLQIIHEDAATELNTHRCSAHTIYIPQPTKMMLKEY